MPGEALILAGDGERRAGWERLVALRGLVPTVTASPIDANWLINDRPITLALMEWHLATGLRRGTSRAVLEGLARTRGAVTTVVCDEAVADREVMDAIHSAHPRALTHDAALGEASLGARLDRLLGRSVGDLCLEHGMVIHSPSGEAFTHPIATQLLAVHPSAVEVPRVGGGAMALLRFRRWLLANGSIVRVGSHRGMAQYRLVVLPDVAVDVELRAA